MSLETIPGDLRAYTELEFGTFCHAAELTTERRTNHDLRLFSFYTADGNLYTAKKERVLWGITREPQNLILQNLTEAFRQLTLTENYVANPEVAKISFEHPNTLVTDVEGLELIKDCEEYGHFTVDPRNPKSLNSQQKPAALRAFGSDEDNFGKNMEMFAKEKIFPKIFVMMPDYVRNALRQKDAQYVARASRLFSFSYYSSFYADDHGIFSHYCVRGVRRGASDSEQEAPQ